MCGYVVPPRPPPPWMGLAEGFVATVSHLSFHSLSPSAPQERPQVNVCRKSSVWSPGNLIYAVGASSGLRKQTWHFGIWSPLGGLALMTSSQVVGEIRMAAVQLKLLLGVAGLAYQCKQLCKLLGSTMYLKRIGQWKRMALVAVAGSFGKRQRPSVVN